MELRVYPLIFVVCCVQLASGARDLDKAIVDDVQNQKADLDKIRELVKNGEFKKRAWDRLAYFTDRFGNRVSGTQGLEDSIDWVLAEMRTEGFDLVEGEEVDVPYWERGEEWAKIVTPKAQDIPILGLGSSVGTGGTLKADAVVVRTFDELEALGGAKVAGKIVVYNEAWTGYSTTVPYRSGADRAAGLGAVATLIKSVADFSLYTPHTGQQVYGNNTKIPTACITIEDAELLQRYYDDGKNISIELMMSAVNHNSTKSRNIVAQINGTEEPNKVVLFGGHIDSWDVGKGVMDDGGGSFISWQALTIMKKLNLKPRRTMRCVLWTAEEEGLVGAHQYYERHKANKDDIVILMEADFGIFKPRGMKFAGSGLGKAYFEEILTLLKPVEADGVVEGFDGPDISMWDDDVPKGSIDIMNDKYFWYHHTEADSMTMLNPDDIDSCSVVWASVAYSLANMENELPRTGTYPESKAGSGVTMAASLALTFSGYLAVLLL